MTPERPLPRLPWWVRAALLPYPPAFRRRYRAELQRMAADVLAEPLRGGRARLLWDLASGAALEWLDLLFRTESPLESLTVMIDRTLRELRLAARRLRRAPGFTFLTITIIALAVGANTAVFTLVNGVLLRPLPYEDPEELAFVWSDLHFIGVPRANISGPQIPYLREHADRFAGFAALRVGNVDLTDDPTLPGQRVPLGVVTGNLFELLGVEASVGRTLGPDEEGPEAPAVAVLTHDLWQSRLGGDPAVVGRDVHVDGTPYRVVGVLPEDFRFAMHTSLGDPRTPQLYIPLDDDFATLSPGNFVYALLARLGDGVSWRQAVAQGNALARDFGREHYRRDDFRFRLVPLHPDLVKDVRPALLMLMAAVGLVLAIACSNVGTLVFGRALAGRREMAVRAALGASAWSRIGPLLLESGVVAAAGGAIGMLVAYGATDLLVALAPGDLPRAAGLSPDWRVLLFSLALTVLVAASIAVVPAIRQRRIDLTEALREGGRGESGRSGAQRAMVVAQVALSGLLLTGAGLMGRSLVSLARVDPGFATDGVTLVDMRVPDYLYGEDADAMALFERLRRDVTRAPGVIEAGWTGSPALSARANQRPYHFGRAPGATGDEDADAVLTDSISASPGYFRAAGIEVLAGRGFDEGDTADGEPVAVIDESLARRFWPGSSAVGGEILVDWGEDAEPVAARVVGVVRQPRLYDVRRDDRGQVYRPLAQMPDRALSLAIREQPGATGIPAEVQHAARELDSRLSLTAQRSIEEVVGEALSSWRFLLQLLGAFAAVALTLSALGLYGVVSLAVTRQTRTIGIRMALGARAAEVGRGVVGQGLRLVLVGLAAALLAALGLGGLLRGFLYGVSPLDPVSLGSVAVLLLAVAGLASWLPARRATRVSPVEAFRAE